MDKSLPFEKVQPQWQLLYLFFLRVYHTYLHYPSAWEKNHKPFFCVFLNSQHVSNSPAMFVGFTLKTKNSIYCKKKNKKKLDLTIFLLSALCCSEYFFGREWKYQLTFYGFDVAWETSEPLPQTTVHLYAGTCSQFSAVSCDECLQLGPQCAWCTLQVTQHSHQNHFWNYLWIY